MNSKFEIRNKDSLDTRDAKMPPELVKAFYDLEIKSILDVGCGSGWLCDYIPPGTQYVGFDRNEIAIKNAKKLHPEGEFVCTTIEAVVSDLEEGLYADRKFDCVFFKCIFCVVNQKTLTNIIKLINKIVTKYIFLYDTEKQAGFWIDPFTQAGFQLIFNHMRGGGVAYKPGEFTYAVDHAPSHVQIWSVKE